MIPAKITAVIHGFGPWPWCWHACLLLLGLILSGCSTQKNLTLMPTPVLYQNGAIDPFSHLTTKHKSTRTHIFYATNRAPLVSKRGLHYGNAVDTSLHLGEAIIRMGEPNASWSELLASSLVEKPLVPVPLTLERLTETARIPIGTARSTHPLSPDQQGFINAINRELDASVDKEIMVYVHGTKVGFANAAILTAEIEHFSGRDFVGLAFAWPSHQNILFYLLGIDVRRARHSSLALKELLTLLAEHSKAEHINILAYSAGGKVASKALFEIRRDYAELNARQLKETFRIASVIFAATDVGINQFLDRLPAISELADQVVITVTDDDNALKAAKQFMGGEVRAGSTGAEAIEDRFIIEHQLSNVEIIDVSFGQEVRGFDITGHHYWYRHPWMSSDIIFLMRTDLPPHRRGLTPTELEGIWYLAPDYPEKVRQAAATELKGQW
ncbi:alpha/beta hydrolase [Oceanisphaera sp. KMM 10153]|uniref:alpha/beta hydrolase n=1 Tax=Oceanisphaera submarina TaxID=3390193 RepID=UPI00397472D2